MKLFFQKIIVAVLPILAIFSFPVFVEIASGEFLKMETVLQKQSEGIPSIYGPAYSDQSVYFKVEMVKRTNPDVLAIGNSKMLTMRSGFFNDNVRFYNAGGTTGDIASFRKFLEATNATPKVLIMIVEPLHFDPMLVIKTQNGDRKYQPISYVAAIGSVISRSWIHVYRDYMQHKFTLEGILKNEENIETIGLNARVNGSGIRNDGSYHYGKQYEDELLRLEKINKAVNFIETKQEIQSKEFFSTEALNELDLFLAYCKQRNIQVIGFIPPTPQVIEDAYKRHSQYDYMFKTFEKTAPLFQKYNFKLYDFFSLSSLGATDEETIDEYHTSEKVMARVLLRISQTDPIIKKITSKDFLESLLEHGQDQNDILK